MEEQLAAFRKKFGRDPGPDDPIFFDPDAPGPEPVTIDPLKFRAEMVVTMVRAEVPHRLTDHIRSVLQEAQKKAKTPYVIEYKEDKVGDIKVGFAAACRRARREALRRAREAPIGTPLRQAWREAARKFKRATAHTLRHTAGTWMAQDGVDLGKIGAWLGHTHEKTTELYAHHHPDYLGDAAEALQKRSRLAGGPQAVGGPTVARGHWHTGV